MKTCMVQQIKNLLLKMIAPERDFRGFCNWKNNEKRNSCSAADCIWSMFDNLGLPRLLAAAMFDVVILMAVMLAGQAASLYALKKDELAEEELGTCFAMCEEEWESGNDVFDKTKEKISQSKVRHTWMRYFLEAQAANAAFFVWPKIPHTERK